MIHCKIAKIWGNFAEYNNSARNTNHKYVINLAFYLFVEQALFFLLYNLYFFGGAPLSYPSPRGVRTSRTPSTILLRSERGRPAPSELLIPRVERVRTNRTLHFLSLSPNGGTHVRADVLEDTPEDGPTCGTQGATSPHFEELFRACSACRPLVLWERVEGTHTRGRNSRVTINTDHFYSTETQSSVGRIR